jgi:PEP-CTERM motif
MQPDSQRPDSRRAIDTRCRARVRSSLLAVTLGLAALPPLAHAQSVVSASPDITIALGAGNVVTSNHAVAADNQLGIVALQNLGTIPESADVTGYTDAGGNVFYFSLDTTTALSGGVVASPADVVSWNGATHAIVFDGSVAGVPSGVQIDAIGTTVNGGLLLSFDTDVSLPGGITAADEDLVRHSGGAFTLVLDGSAAGIDRSLDVDGAQDIGGGHLLSFDTAGTVGAVTFQDEDILRLVGTTWSLAFDASNADADWGAADMDALQVPEPNAIAMVAAGVLGIAAWLRRRA